MKQRSHMIQNINNSEHFSQLISNNLLHAAPPVQFVKWNIGEDESTVVVTLHVPGDQGDDINLWVMMSDLWRYQINTRMWNMIQGVWMKDNRAACLDHKSESLSSALPLMKCAANNITAPSYANLTTLYRCCSITAPQSSNFLTSDRILHIALLLL